MNNNMRLELKLRSTGFVGLAFLLVVWTCLAQPKAKPSLRQQNQSETPPAMIPQIGSAAFSGSDKAWLVTRRAGFLLYSSNGGATWRRLAANQITKTSEISFIDSKHGWAFTIDTDNQGHIWRSSDGGRTWSSLANRSDDAQWRFTGEVQLEFVDKLNGWLIETFSIWRTTDGGVSWKQVFSTHQMDGAQPGRGFFLDALEAWVCGAGEVFKTTDGGKTWGMQTVWKEGQFSDIFFLDRSTGWVSSGPNGQLYRTDDGGRTWRLQPALIESREITSCFFVNKREGWAVGKRLLGPSMGLPETDMENNLVRGIVLHTLDGGETWNLVRVGKNEPFFHRVHFSNTQRGWLFSRDNIYRTTNSGKTWRVVLHLPPIKTSN